MKTMTVQIDDSGNITVTMTGSDDPYKMITMGELSRIHRAIDLKHKQVRLSYQIKQRVNKRNNNGTVRATEDDRGKQSGHAGSGSGAESGTGSKSD